MHEFNLTLVPIKLSTNACLGFRRKLPKLSSENGPRYFMNNFLGKLLFKKFGFTTKSHFYVDNLVEDSVRYNLLWRSDRIFQLSCKFPYETIWKHPEAFLQNYEKSHFLLIFHHKGPKGKIMPFWGFLWFQSVIVACDEWINISIFSEMYSRTWN